MRPTSDHSLWVLRDVEPAHTPEVQQVTSITNYGNSHSNCKRVPEMKKAAKPENNSSIERHGNGSIQI